MKIVRLIATAIVVTFTFVSLSAALDDPSYSILSESELSEMKENIRQRCRLGPGPEKSYPWYYHYELGLALKGKQDWQRALASFQRALEKRDMPARTRIYGMWFVDYYPYYQVGLAHYNLHNWKCAAEAFRLSEVLESRTEGSHKLKNLHRYLEKSESSLVPGNDNR